MKLISAAIVMALLAGSAGAIDEYRYRADVRRVHDGDSLRADIHLGMDLVWTNQALRLWPIDAPELSGACQAEKDLAKKAKDRLVELLASGDVTIETTGREKFGRRLASVWAGDINVGSVLVAEGLARIYYGGEREGWC